MKTTSAKKAETMAPLVVKRPAEERGRTELGWLHSRHTFSFGDYSDPNHMGFRSLRVINDDIVEPGQGFGAHFHRDAEIFSYVIEGELAHKDNVGHGSTIEAGNLQYMSAGGGVRHSEFNPQRDKRVHFLQIWLLPNVPDGEPRYAEKTLGEAANRNALTLLFAGEPREGAIQIRQDAEIHFGKLEPGRSVSANLGEGRHAWLHVITGQLRVLDQQLAEGDGLAVSNVPQFEIVAGNAAEFLLFNLA
jgi:quercetin 2,3-dioxygenase